MSKATQTDYGKSVAGVIIENNKVLLARHIYGRGAGKWIVPGGYINQEESPQEALKREYLEETGLEVEAAKLIGVRFNNRDWYAVFSANVIGGQIKPDGVEIDAVEWVDIQEALTREDVPGLTKALIECAMKEKDFGFIEIPYETSTVYIHNSLFGVRH